MGGGRGVAQYNGEETFIGAASSRAVSVAVASSADGGGAGVVASDDGSGGNVSGGGGRVESHIRE